ncbi:dihydroorotase [Arenibacter sp. GZD96]|uniref:dihydroorotase n=1 Tax=Aurantibrevibacter litoralis TaxID=3106030 RepID=UPI002AFDFA13|nr:dihydroorotase [Arenibacter sp. GZD-96]MEA1787483.1 dihydroorotase [Arenibacter sp. GZD-96]
MNTLIKSAKIIDASNKGHHLKTRDILIENGVISKIASEITEETNTKVIRFNNLHVSLGWFDSSVSFGEPGYEERETIAHGLQVAAKSGFTDIVLNPNTYPVPDSSADIVFLKNAAQGQATRLHPLGSVTVKSEGKQLAELFDMKKSGAVGFYDYKNPLCNSNLLKIALQYAENFDGLIHSFPQDAAISGKGVVNEGEVSTHLGLKGIPALAEELQMVRDLFILEYTGGKLHIPTISTAKAVSLIAEAKKKGLNVSCSVALHNLFYGDEVLKEFETAYKVMPPLRTSTDIKALINGVKDGVIDFVTSDHLPVAIEQKQIEFDLAMPGTLGLETAFGILNTILDTPRAITLLTKGRERFGIKTPKLQEGAAANMTLFDPDTSYVFNVGHILSTSKNSMFLGTQLKGQVYGVFSGNTMVI